MAYIVKNCPAIIQSTQIGTFEKIYTCSDNYESCCNCKDCLFKQVIEKLKEHPFCDCSCGDDILQLFEIEEIKL